MKLLIVDDKATNRTQLRAQLEAEGHAVQEACDGVEALQVLEREQVDAVISDILMPRMDGFRLCREVRQSKKFGTLPFIFYTSTYNSPSARQLAQTVGADQYLVKPAPTNVILDALRESTQKVRPRESQQTLKHDERSVLKQYSEALVHKLVERNSELTGRNQALQQAERQLRLQATALETAANAILIADDTGAIHWVNTAFTTLTGFTPEEVIGKTPRVLKSGRHEAAFYCNLWQTILSGQTWRGEFTNRRKDGTLFHDEHTITPVRSEAGKITHFVGIMHDITDRKHAEESVRQSERLLRLVIDLVPHFIFAKDAESRYLFVNRACAEASGLTPEQMVGVSDLDLVADRPQAESFIRDDQEVIATGRPKLVPEVRLADHTGRMRLLQTTKIPFTAPGTGEPAVLGVAVDITERKRAEQRLATEHAVTRTLAESAGVPETSRKILQIICQSLEWDVGELWIVDRTTNALRCIEIWHPPSTEFNEFVTLSRQATFVSGAGLPGRVWKTGQPVWIPELAQDSNLGRLDMVLPIGLRTAIAFPIKLGDRIDGVISFFSAQIRAPDNELLAMFSTAGSQIGQFIERKHLEDQFRQSQKMEAFGQLAGGVAHDFNNILAVIMGYSDLLMAKQNLNIEMKDQLKQVYAAGERAANLTRQLLTFSRKKEMEVSPLDLNAVIGNMTRMLGRIIGEDINLQCNYASHLPSIQADEGMMEQVLMNLAVNARDAMSNGGQLVIDTSQMVADGAYIQNNPEARAGEFVRLNVRDTGCGMTPEIKARIFEPFFTTKGVGKGTGLGLATVYGIVKQHQGWLEVDSQAGVGTTFSVFLPASLQSAAVAEQSAGDAKSCGGIETILLVEDELALRAMASIVLQRHGYRVLEAGSGVEALEVWETLGAEIDLLVTDMIMPDGMTGRELAKQLQARKPELKLIYTSGYSLDAQGTSFRTRESRVFLQKPYHPQKLIKIVRDVLDSVIS